MSSLAEGYQALVIGATGGIGSAVATCLGNDLRCEGVHRLARTGPEGFDLTDEDSIGRAAETYRQSPGRFDLIFDATGALEVGGVGPEKSLASIDAGAMARQFAVNAVGPALLLKHFAPLLSTSGKSVFATLSARIGSIGDNRLGGWISYRAAKAALNQIVRTAAIEIARKRPHSVCVALHPGTVATRLTEKYAGSRKTFSPDDSARQLLAVLDELDNTASGGFYAYDGTPIVW